LVIQI